ncbi:MAG TPA: malate synthase A [Candidatus Dadabacteria bacterium]|nr:malate synthase A [Candidatus Dadabacteria bacterium]
MIINALNSGANVFMADFEDSLSPTWGNIIRGQINLRDAVARTIEYSHPTKKKQYRLNKDPAILFVRPRGLHLIEKNFLIEGEPVPACLFDFGLYLFHNANTLLKSKRGPYFYLPKLEHYREARWWNDVFIWSQARLGVALGTIKATVLIETLPAVFQMHEILHELQDHSAGLNCGRWDYIFSCIKTFRKHRDRVYPNRDQVQMTAHCMQAYSRLLISTCHRRGAHALGGMAAQIPIKHDPEAHKKAMEAVEEDKLREVRNGHDGTWVAHPGLVSLAKKIFDENMPTPNQIDSARDETTVGRDDLLDHPSGSITEAGLRHNIEVALLYLEAWLRGNGCVPLNGLMEDAATAEISRTQIWQWIQSGEFSQDHLSNVMNEELQKIRLRAGNIDFIDGKYREAADILKKISISNKLENFLTVPAYDQLE